MKQEADTIIESREGGSQERFQIMKEWFDDEHIAQVEIVQFPVCSSLSPGSVISR